MEGAFESFFTVCDDETERGDGRNGCFCLFALRLLTNSESSLPVLLCSFCWDESEEFEAVVFESEDGERVDESKLSDSMVVDFCSEGLFPESDAEAEAEEVAEVESNELFKKNEAEEFVC